MDFLDIQQTQIPTKIVKNLNVIIDGELETINTPLSSYEIPIFASVQRGCNVSKKHPIKVECLNDCMTRSIILQSQDLCSISKIVLYIESIEALQKFQSIVNTTSHHCKVLQATAQIVGNLLYVRLKYNTEEASGHNISTIASNEIGKFLSKEFSLEYISNSGNVCVDKKNSAINSISGRGKHIVAEMIIGKEICTELLRTTPEKVVMLNNKKNLIGSIIAGSVCSANAHYANMVSACFLPFGQDIANIIEASQGITYCEITKEGDLYFSVNLPNIICGVIGNGKDLDFVRNNLKKIGCLDEDGLPVKNASIRLAKIIGSIVLCGELSLLSALTNQDELVNSHKKIERCKKCSF